MEVINTKNEFAAVVKSIQEEDGYREPIMFGICRNDMGVVNTLTILQSSFLVTNVDENKGSAAVLHKCLEQEYVPGTKKNNLIHSTENEEVFTVDIEFIEKAMNMYAPYHAEAKDDMHLNVQAIQVLNDVNNAFLGNEMGGNIFGKSPYTYRVVFIYNDAPVETVEAAYLKLYALSEGKSKIRSLNLNGVFGLLTTCAWTVNGEPVELASLKSRLMRLKAFGRYLDIDAIDKFPRMLQHVIPAENVRITDSSKVRMGAQLAAGTVAMSAAYFNFNAGTEGPCMVEGRVSSSVIVGANSDIGGGASILGVLSGTDGKPITIGENCLLGANSVTGIPLGNGCIVDAGIAILSKTPIHITDTELTKIQEANPDSEIGRLQVTEDGFYAFEFTGLNGLHFRQNSTTGQMTVFRSVREVKLNTDLH